VTRTAGRHRSTSPPSGIKLMGLVAVLILTALYFVAFNPIPPQSDSEAPPAPASSWTAATSGGSGWHSPATPSETAATPAGTDLSGPPAPSPPLASAEKPACVPRGLSIPELGVDAPVVQIGLDEYGNLGVPSDADKKKAGWFPSTLPGSAQGSVIITGHTYHDETAIFRTDFNQIARVGITVQLPCSGGRTVAYRVTEAKLDLGVEDYAAFVDSHRLYATDGPAQVVIITCTDWNLIRRVYDHRGVLIATPTA